jgi:hypothetical protein
MELDRGVLRIAKLGSWSDAEAKRVVGAWRRSGESRAAFWQALRDSASPAVFLDREVCGEERGDAAERDPLSPGGSNPGWCAEMCGASS